MIAHCPIIDSQLDEEMHRRDYQEAFEQIQSTLAQISGVLRTIKTNRVMIPALCDVLWLYANTHTYFTPNENYRKCKGDE